MSLILPQVNLPEIDQHALIRFGAITPQLAPGDTDRVEVLRIFTEAMCVTVREDVSPVMGDNGAALAARIPR